MQLDKMRLKIVASDDGYYYANLFSSVRGRWTARRIPMAQAPKWLEDGVALLDLAEECAPVEDLGVRWSPVGEGQRYWFVDDWYVKRVKWHEWETVF